MENDGHTANGFRTWSTDCGKSGDDVGMLLPYQIYNGPAYGINESKIPGIDRYTYKTDRPAEVNAIRPKRSGIKCFNIGKFYN